MIPGLVQQATGDAFDRVYLYPETQEVVVLLRSGISWKLLDRLAAALDTDVLDLSQERAGHTEASYTSAGVSAVYARQVPGWMFTG